MDHPPQNKPQLSQEILSAIIKYEITRRLIDERSNNLRNKLTAWEKRITAQVDYLLRAEELFEGARLFTEWAALCKETGHALKERPAEDNGLYAEMLKLSNRQFVQFYSRLIKDPNLSYNERRLRRALLEDTMGRHSGSYHGKVFGDHPERALGTKVIKQVKPSISNYSSSDEELQKVDKPHVTFQNLPSHDVLIDVPETTGHTSKKPLIRLWKRIVKYRAQA